MDITQQLSRELSLNPQQVLGTLDLLAQGATVPFIARYRKERTGNLDEEQVRMLEEKSQYYQELEDRRKTILSTIDSSGKLTPELKAKILNVTSKTELEDLYLPYKPKRKTRASTARDAGLMPLAERIPENFSSPESLLNEAAKYLNPEKGIDTPEKALQGACDILAEDLAENADVRKKLRHIAEKEGIFFAKARKEYREEKTKFQMYYDYREKVSNIPSHRMLAMLRGEEEKILSLKLELPDEKILPLLNSFLIRFPRSASSKLLQEAVKDGYSRLLAPAVETEIRRRLRQASEEEAIRVFAANLKELLLAPPAGQKPVLGVDPGYRTGCKVAALEKTGRFLEHLTIYPHEPQNQKKAAAEDLIRLIHRHHIKLIAVGNGTAGRETEKFIRSILDGTALDPKPLCVLISEAGASVYSASPAAAEEFPDLDVTVRGAISIGRRLQDPLSELVKIEPRSIGVGQYQHDVNQARLKSSLENVVESCVNSVGVDVNLASSALLQYVAGLSRKTAERIADFRAKNGPFQTRAELLEVSGMGNKTFEQAAGFLRIPGSLYPLDNSAVHPERYALVERMAESIRTPLSALIGNLTAIRRLEKKDFISEDVGLPTLEDILSELEKPGRDPRRKFQYAVFSEDLQEISDLEAGMILEGIITNVTNFGAFVDIGVHHDGLIHISQIADRYVDDPKKFVKVGQVVKVKVLQVDPDLKRIGLTLRLGPDSRS